MTVKEGLKNYVARGVQLVATHHERELRDRQNVDLVLSMALAMPGVSSEVRYPVAYVELLRTCIEHLAYPVKDVKADAAIDDEVAAKRFATVVDVLRTDVPPIELADAREIALIADRQRALSEPLEYDNWAGDVGLAFSIASGFGRMGRILATIIRFARTERCLELGTAYGVSALFMLAALKAAGRAGHLATVEGWEPQFSLSSSLLTTRWGNAVSCHFGKTEDVLPALVASLGRLDFVFHDAGHTRDDYVRDFAAVEPALAPGAVLLIDDIRWDDPRFSAGKSRAYEGWLEVVAHPRVRRAVEIGETIGLLLMR